MNTMAEAVLKRQHRNCWRFEVATEGFPINAYGYVKNGVKDARVF